MKHCLLPILLAGCLLAEPALAGVVDVAAVCKKADEMDLPDLASAGPAADDCDALDLYYGIGMQTDFRKARACALQSTDEAVIDNDAILSMIFANGEGVTRDDDLAIAYACSAGGAPAEGEGRVRHLLERKHQGVAATHFDFCDDITSGAMEGACAAIPSAKKDIARAEAVKLIDAGLKLPAARAALKKLGEASDAYTEATSENEVDHTGTARDAMEIGAEDEANDAYLALLQSVVSGTVASATGDERAAADEALNATYKSLQAMSDGEMKDLGDVSKDGIRQTERSWIAYRGAFIAFARLAAPDVSEDSLVTALTATRTKALKQLLPDSRDASR